MNETTDPTPHPSVPQVKCGECGQQIRYDEDLRAWLHEDAPDGRSFMHDARPFVPLQPRDEREGRAHSIDCPQFDQTRPEWWLSRVPCMCAEIARQALIESEGQG